MLFLCEFFAYEFFRFVARSHNNLDRNEIIVKFSYLLIISTLVMFTYSWQQMTYTLVFTHKWCCCIDWVLL